MLFLCFILTFGFFHMAAPSYSVSQPFAFIRYYSFSFFFVGIFPNVNQFEIFSQRCSHNYVFGAGRAAKVTRSSLEAHAGRVVVFKAVNTEKGMAAASEALAKGLLNELRLKVDAPVMLITNMPVSEGLTNGAIEMVIGFMTRVSDEGGTLELPIAVVCFQPCRGYPL